METNGVAARFRHRKTPSSDRFLGIFNQSQPETAVSGAGEELNEDDVFWSGDYAESNHQSVSSSASSSSASPAHGNHHHAAAKGFGRAENFGILAALPETETRSVFNHKASVSPSSSSSSTTSFRMIPTIPKRPPLDRQSSAKFHQSAPVNVPVLTEAMRRSIAMREFDNVDDIDDGEGDIEMRPPHEIVAAKQSPVLANSVLEGVGRTLKGRDLRQVRNAVWRRTGFLD